MSISEIRQHLAEYSPPPAWSIGASPFTYSLWFCLCSPLVSCRFLPGSAWRLHLLRFFGANIGCKCRIKPGLRVKFPWKLSVGNDCWLAEDAWIDNVFPVAIGDRVCVSQSVYICAGNHNYRSVSFDLIDGPVTIGSDVWLAARAVIGPGIAISDGAVVALGSVVTSNVPSGAVVAGNPSSFVRSRSPS